MSGDGRPRVLLLRGHHANPWDLRPWRLLGDRFEVACAVTQHNIFETTDLGVLKLPLKALGDHLPDNRAGRAAAYALGDRYLGLDELLQDADIVHAADLRTWFSAQASRLKASHSYKLALTVWETIPFMESYRLPRDRFYRRHSLAATDLYLPASERAGACLRLEGVPEQRIEVASPGIDVEHFASGAPRERRPARHVVLSPGRLVWEKGHQDVLRAFAALRRGLIPCVAAAGAEVLIVGSGPEERRLRRYAGELGIGGQVNFLAAVPYDKMPSVYADASCMVLASLTTPTWEEQFGMVLAESMAAGVPIAASSGGAVPEVVGEEAMLFDPGDWRGLARLLAEGPLARPAGERVAYSPERVRRFSSEAAAERVASAYDRLLAA